ncbi:DUF4440 domain-containing protein [Streptomyces sp. FXJ1.4098]|nr:DUF4440 domain-containing protein [Streptomyces sp. FXJ1.4098]
MSDIDTAEVIRRFNEAFTSHDPSGLGDLLADDCVMVSVQPARTARATKAARSA